MSLYPCSACQQRVPGKLSQVYWAWNRADGSRLAVKQRLCLTCFCTSVLPIIAPAQEDLVSCPLCHIGTVDDMDPVYAAIFMPGQEKISIEMATCGRCAVEVRNRAQAGSEALADRQGQVGGPEAPAPQPSAAAVWADLGLRPY